MTKPSKPPAFLTEPLQQYFSSESILQTLDYFQQLREISFDAANLFSNLTKMARTPLKGTKLLGLGVDWGKKYFSTQKNNQEQEYYFVYTELDKNIPFIPKEAQNYLHIIPQLTFLAKEIARKGSYPDIKSVAATFQEATHLANQVFQKHQTIMYRPKQHRRLRLKLVQLLDRPLNCCPSLHITYALLAHQFAKIFLKPEQQKEFQTSIEKMFASVAYTKQHALIDIGFGMETARRAFQIFQKYSPEKEFDDLTSRFSQLQKSNPQIPFQETEQIYRHASSQPEKTLTEIIGDYFQKNRYPKVRPTETHQFYFDTKTKTLCPLD